MVGLRSPDTRYPLAVSGAPLKPTQEFAGGGTGSLSLLGFCVCTNSSEGPRGGTTFPPTRRSWASGGEGKEAQKSETQRKRVPTRTNSKYDFATSVGVS